MGLSAHLGDPLLAPLAHSLVGADHTVHGPVQGLLRLLQRRHQGHVGDGEDHVGPEDGLVPGPDAAAGRVALGYGSTGARNRGVERKID